MSEMGLPWDHLAARGTLREYLQAPDRDFLDAWRATVAFHIVHGRHTALAWFRTEKGYLGQGDAGVQSGDVVVILHGLRVPLILRRQEEFWAVVGPCYVAGIMVGEAVDGSLDEEDFQLC